MTTPIATEANRSWVHTNRTTLPGTPDRVFAALTTPDELRRWFAEHIEVDPREGGAYRFWGKHSYGTPTHEAARQRITRFEPGRALGFQWDLESLASEVTIELEPATGDGQPQTVLALRHVFPSRLTADHGDELVDDLWRLTLGNLDAHLRGGGGVVLPNYLDPSPEIRLSILIDAPRERVFRALIEPEALNQWVATRAKVDPRIGGEYSYGWEYQMGGRDVKGGPTRIIDLVPNERLVTDWPDWRGDPTRPPTRVAWLLESVGSQTRVTLVHGEFSRVVDQGDYPFGWGEFLSRLKEMLESR